MTTFTVERVVYEVDGPDTADVVLMVHGLGGTSNTFTPLLPVLSGFRVIRPDLPGSGRSDRVEGPLNIERFVQVVQRVAKAAGAERVHLVGHSMGCIVAFHLAVTQPRFVRSLALFGPLLAPPDSARAPIRARGARARAEGVGGMQAIADALLETSVATATRQQRHGAFAFVRESLMRQSPDGYARSCEALSTAEPIDPAAIGCPTLLVTGEEDAVAPANAVRRLAERIDKARCEVLRDCGHWTPLEKPAECGTLLREFLARQR